jgi:hypothetical protein
MHMEELRDARVRFQIACRKYFDSVYDLTRATQRSEWPSADVLVKEATAGKELNLARQALWDSLFSHARAAEAANR